MKDAFCLTRSNKIYFMMNVFLIPVSLTEALRAIVKNCYKHHGRENLLHVFNEDSLGPSAHPISQPQAFAGTMVQTINNPDGTVSFIQIDTSPQSVAILADGTQATVVHAVSVM